MPRAQDESLPAHAAERRERELNRRPRRERRATGTRQSAASRRAATARDRAGPPCTVASSTRRHAIGYATSEHAERGAERGDGDRGQRVHDRQRRAADASRTARGTRSAACRESSRHGTGPRRPTCPARRRQIVGSAISEAVVMPTSSTCSAAETRVNRFGPSEREPGGLERRAAVANTNTASARRGDQVRGDARASTASRLTPALRTPPNSSAVSPCMPTLRITM